MSVFGWMIPSCNRKTCVGFVSLPPQAVVLPSEISSGCRRSGISALFVIVKERLYWNSAPASFAVGRMVTMRLLRALPALGTARTACPVAGHVTGPNRSGLGLRQIGAGLVKGITT